MLSIQNTLLLIWAQFCDSVDDFLFSSMENFQ